MPVYEYECKACGHLFEEWQKMSDEPVKICPKCNEKQVERLISQTSFQLKGGGWYKDLYSSSKSESKSESKSDSKSDTKSESKSDSKSGSGDSGGSAGKSESKSDGKAAKAESKAEKPAAKASDSGGTKPAGKA
jgi:putative FmdB family regulatory protein